MPGEPQRDPSGGGTRKLYWRNKPNQFSTGRGQPAFSLPEFPDKESRNNFIRNINPDQVQLLVDAVQHRDALEKSADVWLYGDSMSGMMSEKERQGRTPSSVPEVVGESWGHGIHEWMSQGGSAKTMRSPMKIEIDKEGDFHQVGAHHRAAVAAGIQEETGEQQLVPVKFIDRPDVRGRMAFSARQRRKQASRERKRTRTPNPNA